MSDYTQKACISPFVAVTFIGVSVTGILMLFHLNLPGMRSIHQWGGLLFVTAGVVHLTLNWQRFITYFKKSKAVWAASIGILALALIALMVPQSQHGKGYHGGGKTRSNYYQQSAYRGR